jgi:DNA-binding protein H-NS
MFTVHRMARRMGGHGSSVHAASQAWILAFRSMLAPSFTPQNTFMATKKTGPTLVALNAQIAKLQAQAEALRATEVASVVARIREAIVHYGLTAADLGLGSAKAKTPKGAAVVASSKSKGKAAGKKAARTIKFTDGQGGTWSGIGKRPNWFKDALAAGKKPEDLLAKPEA